MAKKTTDNTDSQEDGSEQEEEQEDANKEKEKKKTTRGNDGKFKKKAPKKKEPVEEDVDESTEDSDVLKDVAVDLQKEVDLKFGKVDLSHLNTAAQVQTMRSMLAGAKESDKTKKELADTEDQDAESEWEAPDSFLAKYKK